MNITNSEDPFYRYKRPKFELQTFNKKIWILNIQKIAKSLNREPKLLEKYLGKCCSTSTKIIKQKTLEINAVFDTPKLDTFLQIFIDRYVLCPSCDIPETSLSKKNNKIEFDCCACGHTNQLDMKYKFDSLIYNNI